MYIYVKWMKSAFWNKLGNELHAFLDCPRLGSDICQKAISLCGLKSRGAPKSDLSLRKRNNHPLLVEERARVHSTSSFHHLHSPNVILCCALCLTLSNFDSQCYLCSGLICSAIECGFGQTFATDHVNIINQKFFNFMTLK